MERDCRYGVKAADVRLDSHVIRSYTSGMKTAVSLPDEVFADAERLARRLKKPRSRVYSEAIKEYVARHDPDVVTEKLDELMRGPEAAKTDAFVSAASREILERTDW